MSVPSPARPDRSDAGFAMMVVIGAMSVVTLLLMVSLAVVVNNAAPSRRDQDDKAALAAAQAGIEDYLARLDVDDAYWSKGNVDPGNPALTADPTALGSAVPAAGTGGASFRYQMLSTPSEVATNGTIRLKVTGLSGPASNAQGKVRRSLTVTLSPKGFLRYGYFSDIEATDPSLLFTDPVYVQLNGSAYYGSTRYKYAITAAQACPYYYAGRSTSPNSLQASPAAPVKVFDTSTGTYTGTTFTSGTATLSAGSCGEIQWASGDVVRGPLHSNDALQVNGSVLFTGSTESSWPACETVRPDTCWWGTGTPSAGTGSQPGHKPGFAPALPMPAANSELLRYVEPGADPSVDPADRGCRYTGATRLTFTTGAVKVLSPGTTSAAASCYNTAQAGTEQVISPIPPVIYVDATSGACATVGYPMSGEWTGGLHPDYDCRRGTAFVRGTVAGRVTVAGKDDIVITGDLTVADPGGADVVGLIADNYVWVYHPVSRSCGWTCSYTELLSSAVHRIDAAILSLNHSFLVQDYNRGAPLSSSANDATKLNVHGSIAQKFRGPVGTGNSSGVVTGYLKNYSYDERFMNLQPPHFLTPVDSPWEVSAVADG